MMQIFPQMLINVPIKIKPEISGVPEIVRIIKEVEKELGEERRVLVRYSGTEPLCRVMVEGKDKDQIERSVRMIADVIKKELNA
jgi:phosphoglucosamine mutase